MDFLLPIAAIAGAVWLAWFALRGSLVVGCLAALLTICCFGYPFLHFDGGPLPLTIDRLAIVALVGIYVLQRALGSTDPKPLVWADKLLLAFLALLVVSTFTHRWSDLPPGVVSPVWRLFTGFITPAIIYWVARQSRLTARQIGWVQGSLVVFGVYLAATGLLEVAQQWSWVFPRLYCRPERRNTIRASPRTHGPSGQLRDFPGRDDVRGLAVVQPRRFATLGCWAPACSAAIGCASTSRTRAVFGSARP